MGVFFGSRKNRENGFFVVVVVLPGKLTIESAIMKWSLMSKIYAETRLFVIH